MIFSELFPNAYIFAFEPLPDCYTQLEKNTLNREKIKIFKYALGSENSIEKINASSWEPASSFRQMGDKHKENYPHSSEHKEIEVKIKKLDDVINPELIKRNILVKIDVQGFEDEVIKGGLTIFERAYIVILEVSFIELYKEEPLFNGIYTLLIGLGFKFHGSLKQSEDKLNGMYLQADCIFINSKIS